MVHITILNEQASQTSQAGGDSAAAASPADAASSAVGRPKYQPLTEEKIMLPKNCQTI